jgi:hypothetical protein
MLFITVENLVAGLAGDAELAADFASLIASPSKSRATNRTRSSITEHSFHGIDTPRLPEQTKSVTHVSGTKRHCLGPHPPSAVAGIACSDTQTVIDDESIVLPNQIIRVFEDRIWVRVSRMSAKNFLGRPG